MSTNQRNIKWVEGLRGITSVLVLVTHVARAFDYKLFFPRDDPFTQPRLLQLPWLRIPWQGRIGVPIFAFLTGFVCAYKPLKLAYHQGNQAASLKSVAKSAFRRPPRLMLPAAIATTFSMICSLLGFYAAAEHCDARWARFDAPDLMPVEDDLVRYFWSLITTWTSTENLYDRHQWAMRPLLVGAFQVYGLLAATMGMRFRYRVMVHATFFVSWLVNKAPLTETFGANMALGTLLADLSLHRPTQNFIASHQRILSYLVAPLLLIIGGYVGSYPHEQPDWSDWSRDLRNWLLDPSGDGSRGSFIVPQKTDPLRRTSSFFIQCLATAIFLSAGLRDMMSHRWLLWLGHHSFAVYLVHGTLLRTVGIWIAYGFSGEPWKPTSVNPDGTVLIEEWLHVKSNTHVAVAVLVFIMITYMAAWLWMNHVDTACARITAWLEKKMFESEDENGRQSQLEKGFSGQHVTESGPTAGPLEGPGSSRQAGSA